LAEDAIKSAIADYSKKKTQKEINIPVVGV